ncbi:MAG: hypothetical protein V4456_11650 [Bacteroidota bacterium]
MKRLIIIFLSLVFTIQVKAQNEVTVWTSIYEKTVYNQYYNLAKDIIHDEFTKQQFSNCCVEKTKTMLPRGLESVSDDELNRISKTIVNSCAMEIKNKLIFRKWTPEIEDYLKASFISNDTTMNITYRTEMAVCMIDKLKIIYPDGLNGSIPDDVAGDLSQRCAKELMKNLKWTPDLEASIKESFAAIPGIKKLKPIVREAVCNCYIRNAKKIYPNGLPNGVVSKEAGIKIFNACPIKKIQQALN